MAHATIATPIRHGWYVEAIVRAVEHSLEEAGVTGSLHVEPYSPGATDRLADRLDHDLADTDCVGAVLIDFDMDAGRAEQLHRHGKRIVTIGGRSATLPSVFMDEEAAAHAATRHLLDAGHTAIAHLTSHTIAISSFTYRTDRARGYSRAMREAGLEESSHVITCEFDRGAARCAAIAALRGEDRPTAIFAVADELAFGVLDAADEAGLRVPAQLAVIGIDDEPRSAARGLSTLRQDADGYGAAAVDLLLGRGDGRSREFPFEPMLRASTVAGAREADGGRPNRRGFLSRLR